MPTFNQLVKQGRTDKTYKSKAPVLQKGFNTLNNVPTNQSSPQKTPSNISFCVIYAYSNLLFKQSKIKEKTVL